MDRAVSAIGGTPLNYVSFGPRRPPETSAELREIFSYNEFGEAEYRAPLEPETEEFLPLAGLPESSAQVQVAAVPYEAPAYQEPPRAIAPAPVAAPIAAPRPQYQPDPPPEPVQRPAVVPPISAPATYVSPPPVQQARRPEPAPPLATDSFGLPELWRDRREAGSPTSAPAVEERALAAMFRMLGNRAHGGSDAGGVEEDQAKKSFNELFRRL